MLLKTYFKDAPYACEDCLTLTHGAVAVCQKLQPCYHQIQNAKITSAQVQKKEPLRLYQFHYSVTFHNKLRPKSEETLTILLDEKGATVNSEANGEMTFLGNPEIAASDLKSKLKPEVFDRLKQVADEQLFGLLRGKLLLFDLPLKTEKVAKLNSYAKRLRRERREQVISRKHEFDVPQWHANYAALMQREEESFVTHVDVKFINLLVVNTCKVNFEIALDNNSAIHSTFILGVTQPEVTCPLCKKTFSEGYATQDHLYVCKTCTRQFIESGKVYSKKAALAFDETLSEYLEPDAGFVCSVCGKRHSRLLEYKCSHDGSSVCIQHYELCGFCGKVFSKLNLAYTQEFKRQLCPEHATKCQGCQSTIGIDEAKHSETGKVLCAECFAKQEAP